MKNEKKKKAVSMNYVIYLYSSKADPRDTLVREVMGVFTDMERATNVFKKYKGTTGVNLVLWRLTDTQLGDDYAKNPSDEEIDQFFQKYINDYGIITEYISSKSYDIWCDYYDYQEDCDSDFKPELTATFHCFPEHALAFFRKCENDRYVIVSRVFEIETSVESPDEYLERCKRQEEGDFDILP